MPRCRRFPVLALFGSAALLMACSAGNSSEPTGDSDAATTAPTATTQSGTGQSGTAEDDAGATTTGAETATSDSPETTSESGVATATGVERAYYILPPGNFGGVPTNDDSLDQLEMYSGLTPLRADITDADLESHFVPQDFAPVGATTVEDTGHDGVEIVYDEFGVAHVTGNSSADVAFGAGWVTARDRSLLFTLGRGPARVALADVPGIDAFGLVTSGRSFVPSAATEQLVDAQIDLLKQEYGSEGDEIIADAQAYADGINAYWAATGQDEEPATVNDVIATTAFIGSIFGAGGGDEASYSAYLADLQTTLGEQAGREVFDELVPTEVPDTATTLGTEFDYPVLTGGDAAGSVVIDAGSLTELSIGDSPVAEAASTAAAEAGSAVYVRPTERPPYRTASNWLLVGPQRSANGTTLAVMGPQLGYYYPEIVQQIHLTGPDYEVQGAAVPGLSMYMLIGRSDAYAWSLTSANHDVRDVFAEKLCEPDGATPTVDSRHYIFDDECIAFETFDAGTLDGQPLTYPISVHGPMIGTATVDGAPIALTRQRSTFGRDALNLVALKRMTEGAAKTADEFFETANEFGFTFNWGYANNSEIGYFSSGRLPERAPGLDRRLPTWGTGEYEWRGFLPLDAHPHSSGDDLLVNWNNQSAPGFIHGDAADLGSNHRVELFDQWPEQVQLTDVVGVMNRAAGEDTRDPVWPVIREALNAGEAPSPLATQVVEMLDAWVADDAPRIDADDDGKFDDPAAGVMDLVFDQISTEAFATGGVDIDRGALDRASVIDTTLRGLLGQGPGFSTTFCGTGDLASCADAMWASIDTAANDISDLLGGGPDTWSFPSDRTTFVPGLIPNDFPTTNRPTYQQVIEFSAP